MYFKTLLAVSGENWKQWQILVSCAPKSLHSVTAAMIWKDSCFWKKSYDKFRQCIKKQKHYFADKGPYVKSILFPVVMYWHESWTIKKDECWKIDASKLWRWRRLVRVPWTVNKSSQSILKKKKINPEYSLEEQILKLKLQYFGHLIWSTSL